MANPKILLLGPPGAGKGTQSDNIVERFDVDHVETGDMFRSNKEMDISHLDVEYDTPGEFMDRGELVPDEVVNEMVRTELDGTAGFVLDGYPRTMNQVEALEEMTDLDVVVYVDVPEDELARRLTGRRICEDCGATYHVDFDPPAEPGVCDECGGDLYQREDDQEDVVRERIRVYEENTAPVVEHYEDQGDLARVDGSGTPAEVWEHLEAAIEDAIDDD